MTPKDSSMEARLSKVLQANEVQTNKFVDKINWLWTGLFTLFLVIDIYYIEDVSILNIYAIIGYIVLFIAAHFIVKRIGYDNKWSKLIFTIPLIVSSIALRVISIYNPTTIFAFLIMISGLYINRKYVIWMSISVVILLILTGIAYVLVDYDRMASFYELTVHDQLVWHALPNLIIVIIITIFSIFVADSSKNNLLNLLKTSTENAAMHNELIIAKSIQDGTLSPKASINRDYEIHAFIESAKDVGGDFYNYRRVDERTLAFCIADVSGKGIPAAVMATNTNTFIESYVDSRGDASGICEAANRFLCSHNAEKLFETAFFGQLNISNGMFGFANAGHTAPILLHPDGTVETLKCKPNFVIGRKPDFKYVRERIFLKPGDKIFLYTDGITEAMNDNGELFGTQRLISILEKYATLGGEQMVESVKSEVKAFAGDAEQSDDMTMLVVSYKDSDKTYKIEEQSFEIKPENLQSVKDFVLKNPRQIGCSELVQNELAICVDEIFANLDMHAYSKDAAERPLTVKTAIWENHIKISFADKGVAFNPLETDTFKAKDGVKLHKKGGLGIFLIHKLTNSVTYNYTNTYNILTITKNLDKQWI